MNFKKLFGVFLKTAAVIASVAGIAYVVKQVLDKNAEDEDNTASEREYVDINIASAEDSESDDTDETADTEEADPAQA